MQDIKEILDFHIYPNLNMPILLNELNPVDKGGYYLLNCPSCGKHESFLYKDSVYINCNRLNQCGISVSIWDYIQQNKGLSNRETLEELAANAGVSLPALKDYNEEKAIESQQKSNILEIALIYFKNLITEDIGSRACEYLLSRGYTIENIMYFQAGHFPSQETLKNYLYGRSVTEEQYQKSGLATSGLGSTHQLALPYRDPVGRLKGFIVRAISPDIEPKYKYTFGLEKDSFFNFNKSNFHKDIIIVEGFLDALHCSAKGIKNVVATGGAIPSRTQIDNAVKYGVKSFTLALDSDEAGRKATARTVDLLQQRKIPCYVVSLPLAIKDPDEFIIKKGINEFNALLRNAESSIKWKIDYIYLNQDLSTDKGIRDAKDESIEFALSLHDSLDIKNSLNIIAKNLGLSPIQLDKEFSDYLKQKARGASIENYRKLSSELQKLLHANKLDAIRPLLEDNLRYISSIQADTLIDSYTFDDFLDEIKRTPEGLLTGYSKIDDFITIKSGTLTIVAGRPRHGKTTFMLNILLNFLNKYPEKTFIFFSYEEAKKDVLVKILTLISGEIINKMQNIKNIEYYMRGRLNNLVKIPRDKIESGVRILKSYFKNSQFKIIDSPLYVNELTDTLTYLKSRYDIGAVFIDYIQKIKIKGKYQSRQIEIQKVSEQILEISKSLSLPIILGAQFNREALTKGRPRLENLRESGDIENDANTILGVYNESVENQDPGNNEFNDPVSFEVIILKNRNGRSNETIRLMFDRPLLQIYEEKTNDMF